MASLSDDFNRADSGTVGNSWLETTGSESEILSNKLRIGGAVTFPNSVVYRPASEDFKNGTVSVDFTITANTAVPQIHMRYNDASNNSYILYTTSTQLILGRMTSGSVTQLDTASFTRDAADEYTLEFSLFGNNKLGKIKYKDTGAPIVAVSDSADTTYTSADSVGISNDVSAFVDYDNFYASGETSKAISPTGVLHDGTSVLASETGIKAYVLDFLTGARVTTVTGLTTDASGNLSSIDNDTIDNKRYKVLLELSGGERGLIRRTDQDYPRIYCNTSDLQTGKYTAVKYDGLGIPGNQVPSTGKHSGGFLYGALSLPSENNDEFRCLVTTAPAVTAGGGSITAYKLYDDTSFDLESSIENTVEWTYTVYKNNASDTTGVTATVTFTSDTEITATTESLTLTTNAATTEIVYDIDAALESLTLTAFPVSVGGDSVISATLESLTLSTYQAGIEISDIIEATTESLTYNTFQAVVTGPIVVRANTEQLTLTAYNVTITAETGWVIQQDDSSNWTIQ